MASLVTSVIGGVQGASASHNAAGYLQTAEGQASQRMGSAVGSMNPYIQGTADTAADYIRDTAGDAAAGAIGAAGNAGNNVRGAAATANGLLNPYIDVGNQATVGLKSFLQNDHDFGSGDFQQDPGYQFRLQQGQQALERSAAARGAVMGGAALKSLTRYNSGVASQEYGAAFDRYNTQRQGNYARLSGLAGMGATAADRAGQNTMGAETFAGNADMGAAQYAGNIRTSAASAGNQYRLGAASLINQNTLGGAAYQGQRDIDASSAHAAGDLGAANQWNAMLSAIGKTGDAGLAAAFGGPGDGSSGGFWGRFFKGAAGVPAGSK